MYGVSQKELPEIKQNLLIVIGAEKVPRQVYKECDFNVSITSQPHSEVAALAVFLHDFFQGSEAEGNFAGGNIKVFPNPRGKSVEKHVKA